MPITIGTIDLGRKRGKGIVAELGIEPGTFVSAALLSELPKPITSVHLNLTMTSFSFSNPGRADSVTIR
jgi:hypothetical protein